MPVRERVTATINENSNAAPALAGISANEFQGRFSIASHSRCHSGSRQGSTRASGISASDGGESLGCLSIRALLKCCSAIEHRLESGLGPVEPVKTSGFCVCGQRSDGAPLRGAGGESGVICFSVLP